MKIYSQNSEQNYIVEHFGQRTGRLLDIGAYDGLTFSNARRLLELGWHGILIEPAPSVIPKLRANVECFGDRVEVMTCAVGTADGVIDFYDNAGAVATTSKAHVAKWRGQTRFSICSVTQVTPATLLDLIGSQFDFINIDVEGANIDVMRLMPWHRLMPELSMVCVEHDGHKQEIEEMLKDYGFKTIHENRENLILTR